MKKKTILLIAAMMVFTAGCGTANSGQDTGTADKTTESIQSPTVSSTEEQSGTESTGTRRITPIPSELNLDDLSDLTVAAGFTPEDISEENGKTEITLDVYDYETFDPAAISEMQVGDTLVIDGEDVLVKSLESSDNSVTVNGGIEEDGFDLLLNEDGVYYENGMDDYKAYYEIGSITLPMSDDCTITDNSDLEHQNAQYAKDDFVKNIQSIGVGTSYTAQNTSIHIVNGEVTEIIRSYTP